MSLPPRRTLGSLLVGIALFAPGCGGGGGADGGGSGGAPTTRPDVALLLVSGHAPISGGADYLPASVGAYLQAELGAAGHDVEVFSFVDAGTGPSGFGDLKARLGAIRDDWIAGQAVPTRVVLVAHSHGGPWAHAASRDVADCPIRCFVDLDTNSYGWALTHAGESSLLGGDPDDAYTIALSVNPPAYPAVPSEPGSSYDLEDVIFPSIVEAFEVVSADQVPSLSPPFALQRYDTRWNARLDGTTAGLWTHYSGLSHGECALAPSQGGTTMVVVKDWILSRLAVP